MNIFHKTALQGLLKNRTRTVVTVVGVMLSAALLTGVTVFGISLLDYLARGAAEIYGGWHAAFFDVPAGFVRERAQEKGVLDVAFTENIGYAVLEGSGNPDVPYLFLAGYDEKALRTLPPYVISGRLPENDREILVSGGVQASGGVELREGSTITLDIGSRTSGGRRLGQRDRYDAASEMFTPYESRTFTVVGICQRPQYEQDTAPGFTLITKVEHTAPDSCNAFVTLDHPRRVRSYLRQTKGEYAAAGNDKVLRFLGLSDDRLFTTLLFAVGGAVTAIIMTGSVFLIHNAFSISLSERIHQFGILLSVGATERQLRSSVLFEGMCIGLAGIPAGILLGIAVTRAVIAVVARSFQSMMYGSPLVLVVSPLSMAAAAAIAWITILISAYLPARRAAAVPVMECIRQTGEIRMEAKTVRTSRFIERVCSVEVLLALKNFKRNQKRCRSIVLSLALSVVLFISANSFRTALQQASEAAAIFTTFDLALSSQAMEDAELLALYDRLKGAEGVTESGYQEIRRYVCTVPAAECTDDLRAAMGPGERYSLELQIQFLDRESWRKLLERAELSEAAFSGPGERLICIAKLPNHVNRLLEPDAFVDMFSADTLKMMAVPKDGVGQRREIELDFVSVVGYDSVGLLEPTEKVPYYFLAMAPWEVKGQFDAPGAAAESKGMTFRSDNPARTAAEMQEILSGAHPAARYFLFNMQEMSSQNTNMIFIASVFAYVFIGMISLIAAANVLNTISTSIRLRRRELAMLRSVGMSERGFQKMMNFECVFYGLQALLAGIPLSVLSSWLIYQGMLAGGAEDVAFVMPWAAIGVSVFGVLLMVFIAMWYAVGRIKKENIIDALRDELS